MYLGEPLLKLPLCIVTLGLVRPDLLGAANLLGRTGLDGWVVGLAGRFGLLWSSRFLDWLGWCSSFWSLILWQRSRNPLNMRVMQT